MSMSTFAFIARSEGRSKGRSGSTRPVALGGASGLGCIGAAGADAALAATTATPPAGTRAPMAGPRSANASRVPFKRPASRGTRGCWSNVKSPDSRLDPMLARASTTFHTAPLLAMRPLALNGPVVGKVTPTGSPTAASDGPCIENSPCKPAKRSASVAVPLKTSDARPTCASMLTGSGSAPTPDTMAGVRPDARRSIFSGSLR